MSKFDTHGGYFAPKDYLKVNEGGSHEENPNGGVQIGVDPEGNPNLLEEGEPVYKDYVYSDNITAEKEFLEQNHLPGKYDGKLYSKIADDILSEAEERPLDPISRNGLEALLGRLADAQEGQKQRDQQKQLEDELSNLSPEELDQLEAMLAQEQLVGEDNPMYGEGPVGALGEPGVSPEPIQQPMEMPMMANGGFLRVFDDGSPGKVVPDKNTATSVLTTPGGAFGGGSRPEVIMPGTDSRQMYTDVFENLLEASPNKSLAVLGTTAALKTYNDWKDNSAVGEFVDSMLPTDASQAFSSPLMRQANRVTGPIGRSVSRGFKNAISAIKNAPKHLLEVEGRKTMLQEAKAVVQEAKEASVAARNTANNIAADAERARAALAADPANKALQQQLAELEAKSAKADVTALKASARTLGARVEAANKTVGAFTGGPMYNRAGLEKEISGLQKAYDSAKAAAEAAPKDKVLQETAESALKALEKAKGNWNKIWGHGEWRYKVPIGGVAVGYGVASRDKEKKQNWVESQFGEGGHVNKFWPGGDKIPFDYELFPKFPTELRMSDIYPPVFTVKDRPGAISSGVVAGEPVQDIVEDSILGRYLGLDAGVPWYETDDINPSVVIADRPAKTRDNSAISTIAANIAKNVNVGQQSVADASSSSVSNKNTNSNDSIGNSLLPTFPRYAGAIGSGLLSLYNAFQSPDRYTQRRLNPQLLEGRIHLQNEVYNPIDQNMVANTIASQANATNRALRNSGFGPSTASAVLAADNNATTNLGTGFIQTWDANNQRRNAVIAANNQAEAQRANFDYTVDAARKQILNDAAYKNAYNDLMLQRLNYEAEGDKYQAISNQIANGLQALSGIGRENFAMNQINTNPAYLGYRVGPNGEIYYFNQQTGKYEPKVETVASNPKPTTVPVSNPLYRFNTGLPYSTDPFMGYNKWTLDEKKKKKTE